MCSGPMFQYQICNSEECPGPYEDFRAQQCAKRSSYYVHQNAKHSWIPYEPDDGEWGPVPSTSRPMALGLCWVLIFPDRAFLSWPTSEGGGTVAAPKGHCSWQVCPMPLCRPLHCIHWGPTIITKIILDLNSYAVSWLMRGQCLEQGSLGPEVPLRLAAVLVVGRVLSNMSCRVRKARVQAFLALHHQSPEKLSAITDHVFRFVLIVLLFQALMKMIGKSGQWDLWDPPTEPLQTAPGHRPWDSCRGSEFWG